jgi:murein DD-endopeptidase MepM/ murein hydrolase activator NlpD
VKPLRSGLALVVVLLSAAAPQGVQTPKESQTKSALERLKSDLDRIASKRKSASKKLATTKKAVSKARGDLRQIDGRLGELESQLARTTSELSRSKADQVRLSGELRVAVHRLQERREQVRARLRWMYVHQNTGVVSALLKSSDVGDFASRAYLTRRIANADRELFDEYEKLKASVAEKKARQDRLVVRITDLKQSQENQQVELKGVRSDKASTLEALRRQQRSLERLIAELDAEESQIEARIAQYYRGAGKTSGLAPFSGRFSKPVSGLQTSGFGMRMHPILRRRRMHNGIDFGAAHGTPIHAAAAGIVIAASYGKGYGNMVMLDHGGGISTVYGHCSRILVKEGQRIDRGQRIALVGSTGLATGPHLHWEVRINGKPVNPAGRF